MHTSPEGPDLPQPMDRLSMISFGDSVITVGSGSKLFKLTCKDPNSCQWTVLPQQLQQGRTSTVAMLIPDSMATCD